MNTTNKTGSQKEFVAVMGLLMALSAFSTDIMLPALDQIGADLQVSHPNDIHLVITLLFAGVGIGQIFYGPLSDSVGRKPAVLAGLMIFFVGSLLAVFAQNFDQMCIGRFLQGLGLAAARSITIALVRDLYQGRYMARVMSFIMLVFIFMPMVAPAVGQAVLLISHWRGIFVFLVLMGVVTLTWFMLRVPETLALEKRKPFQLRIIIAATREVLCSLQAMLYTLIGGLIFGSFMAYLSTAQQILQFQYGLGHWFALVFASITVFGAVASFSNGKVVIRLGMHRLVKVALWNMIVASLIAAFYCSAVAADPPLWGTLVYFAFILYSVSSVFANINAMAMEPLGHIAGVAASVVGCIIMLSASLVGNLIARQYVDSIMPLVFGFLGCSLLALVLLSLSARFSPGLDENSP